jgi:hypothetical protein
MCDLPILLGGEPAGVPVIDTRFACLDPLVAGQVGLAEWPAVQFERRHWVATPSFGQRGLDSPGRIGASWSG